MTYLNVDQCEAILEILWAGGSAHGIASKTINQLRDSQAITPTAPGHFTVATWARDQAFAWAKDPATAEYVHAFYAPMLAWDQQSDFDAFLQHMRADLRRRYASWHHIADVMVQGRPPDEPPVQ